MLNTLNAHNQCDVISKESLLKTLDFIRPIEDVDLPLEIKDSIYDYLDYNEGELFLSTNVDTVCFNEKKYKHIYYYSSELFECAEICKDEIIIGREQKVFGKYGCFFLDISSDKILYSPPLEADYLTFKLSPR